MYAAERVRAVWFFYQRLIEQESEGNFTEFGYYLEAIISLARSITHCIQKEFAHTEGFQDWYRPKQEEMKNDEHFKFFNKKRVDILKRGLPLRKIAKYSYFITYPGELKEKPTVITKREGEKIKAKLVYTENNEIEVPGAKVYIDYLYYFEDKSKIQAMIFLHQYLRKLDILVAECERRFSS